MLSLRPSVETLGPQGHDCLMSGLFSFLVTPSAAGGTGSEVTDSDLLMSELGPELIDKQILCVSGRRKLLLGVGHLVKAPADFSTGIVHLTLAIFLWRYEVVTCGSGGGGSLPCLLAEFGILSSSGGHRLLLAGSFNTLVLGTRLSDEGFLSATE